LWKIFQFFSIFFSSFSEKYSQNEHQRKGGDSNHTSLAMLDPGRKINFNQLVYSHERKEQLRVAIIICKRNLQK
jgi:hypothetical protein